MELKEKQTQKADATRLGTTNRRVAARLQMLEKVRKESKSPSDIVPMMNALKKEHSEAMAAAKKEETAQRRALRKQEAAQRRSFKLEERATKWLKSTPSDEH